VWGRRHPPDTGDPQRPVSRCPLSRYPLVRASSSGVDAAGALARPGAAGVTGRCTGTCDGYSQAEGLRRPDGRVGRFPSDPEPLHSHSAQEPAPTAAARCVGGPRHRCADVDGRGVPRAARPSARRNSTPWPHAPGLDAAPGWRMTSSIRVAAERDRRPDGLAAAGAWAEGVPAWCPRASWAADARAWRESLLIDRGSSGRDRGGGLVVTHDYSASAPAAGSGRRRRSSRASACSGR